MPHNSLFCGALQESLRQTRIFVYVTTAYWAVACKCFCVLPTGPCCFYLFILSLLVLDACCVPRHRALLLVIEDPLTIVGSRHECSSSRLYLCCAGGIWLSVYEISRSEAVLQQ